MSRRTSIGQLTTVCALSALALPSAAFAGLTTAPLPALPKPLCAAPTIAEVAPDASVIRSVKSLANGSESTVATDTGYSVSRCAKGKWSDTKVVQAYGIPGGRVEYITVAHAEALPGGGGVVGSASLADPVTDADAGARWRGGAKLGAEQLPAAPTQGTFVPSPAAALSAGAPSSGDGGAGSAGEVSSATSQCSATGSVRWAGRWSGGNYSYRVRLASMPNGTTTRIAITDAHHNWDNTYNNCGVADGGSTSSNYLGDTSTSFHTAADNQSVVDFGSMSNIGQSDSTTLAFTQFWWSNNLGTETDQRYNSAKSWSTSGSSASYDVENIATHETGHSIGLGDLTSSNNANLTMFGTGFKGEVKKRTLGLGDIQGMQSKY